MRTDFMGTETPSLNVLFGDEVEQDIIDVAAETGLPVEQVRAAVRSFSPELLGEDVPRGTTFGNVFKAIAEGIGQAAPGIAAAARGTPAQQQAAAAAPAFNYQSLILPAGIGAAILLVVMMRNKKKRR